LRPLKVSFWGAEGQLIFGPSVSRP
jgi:hypothetical protein